MGNLILIVFLIGIWILTIYLSWLFIRSAVESGTVRAIERILQEHPEISSNKFIHSSKTKSISDEELPPV